MIDTNLEVQGCQWNHNGRILAVAGKENDFSAGNDKETNVVQFYSNSGKIMRSLKVPGKEIADCTWEGGSLRIALAVDSFIYFANIRPNYVWTSFANVIVYTFFKAERQETLVAFWNTKTSKVNKQNLANSFMIITIF